MRKANNYQRTIMIFPQFNNHKIIDEIREKYDPLYHLVKPHITLVFPFQSEISDEELSLKMDECLENINSFPLILQGISRHKDIYGNYMFLNVKSGSQEIIEIHKSLYRSLFNGQCPKSFIPHMTIGNLDSKDKMEAVYDTLKNVDICFESTVEKVSVERIGEHGESIIIIEKDLSQKPFTGREKS